MKRFAEYEGGFLNHLEGFYRAEDRELAVELAQALELAVSEIRFTAQSRPVTAVHPNADDRDPTWFSHGHTSSTRATACAAASGKSSG